jgi:hypothetical protein
MELTNKILYKIKFSFFSILNRVKKNVFWEIKCRLLYLRTILFKKCFISPFTGELGHLLGHVLPFIAHLKTKNVKVEYCGLEIHRPFFVDELGVEITHGFFTLRDFFEESSPNSNMANEPHDIKEKTTIFVSKAQKSIFPYWNLSNFEFYFYFFRWWILKNKFLKVNDLSKIYKTSEENSVVLFPRKWNNNVDPIKQLENNGAVWDYLELCDELKKYFTKVYVVGHPLFTSFDFKSYENVEVIITNNNRKILEVCSNSNLIVTPHSGANYLGVYVGTPVLMIYKGDRKIGEIEITEQFRRGLGQKHPLSFAYNLEEVIEFVRIFSNKN